MTAAPEWWDGEGLVCTECGVRVCRDFDDARAVVQVGGSSRLVCVACLWGRLYDFDMCGWCGEWVANAAACLSEGDEWVCAWCAVSDVDASLSLVVFETAVVLVCDGMKPVDAVVAAGLLVGAA